VSGPAQEGPERRSRLVVAGPISLAVLVVGWAIFFSLLTCSVPAEFAGDQRPRPADERLAPVLGPEPGDRAAK